MRSLDANYYLGKNPPRENVFCVCAAHTKEANELFEGVALKQENKLKEMGRITKIMAGDAFVDMWKNSLYQSSETVVLQYVFETFKELSCNISSNSKRHILWKIFSIILTGAWRVGALIALRYLVQNPGKFGELYNTYIYRIILHMCYYRRTYTHAKNDENDFIVQKINSINPELDPLIPITVWTTTVENMPTYTEVYTLPFVHRGLVAEAEAAGRAEYDKVINTRNTLCIRDSKVKKPLQLFPSSNYRQLNEMINSDNEIAKLTGMRQPRAILIDGTPGLGKTCSVDALAVMGCGKYDAVCRIDMTKYINKNSTLRDIFYATVKPIPNIKDIIIVLYDEMDKYLDLRIKIQYEAHVKKLKKEKVPEGQEPMPIPEYEHFYIRQKETFLMELLHLIEIDDLNYTVVFLFCANNFDTIFDKINMTHFHSLKERLIKIEYEKCDKSELIEYITHYNNALKNSRWYYEPDKLAHILSQIKEDLAIPYRILSFKLMICNYNLEKFVCVLNDWEYVRPPSPTVDDLPIVMGIAHDSNKLELPTEDDIIEPEKHENSENYAIPSNGVVRFDRKKYYADSNSYYRLKCECRFENCTIGVFCLKCKESCCVQLMRYLCYSKNADGEGYLCHKCVPNFDAWKYYPMASDLKCENNEEYGFIGKLKDMGTCIRGSMGRGFGGCSAYLKCMKCMRNGVCSCGRKYKEWKKNPNGNGYVCAQCSRL